MDIEKKVTNDPEEIFYELLPVSDQVETLGALLIMKRRVLVGRSRSCDVVIAHADVSAIHAVIEIGEESCKLYDMNSSNGTLVNDEKIVAGEIKLGDTLSFGKNQYVFKKYVKQDLVPPVLDMLHPELPMVIDADEKKTEDAVRLPKAPQSLEEVKEKELEQEAVVEVAPEIVKYPLAQDPKAEYTEYIFEDGDTLYPIFKYEINKSSVEVIILFKEKVFSVDYLPLVDQMYRLVGKGYAETDIEYPYLAKDEEIAFVEIANGDVFVKKIEGYDCLSLSDELFDEKQNKYALNPNDIFRFSKGDVQIFVRGSEAPPVVKSPPVMGRDHELNKYIAGVLSIVFVFLLCMQVFSVDKEIEKEKNPERIATILYKKKFIAPKPKPVKKIVKKVKKKLEKPKKLAVKPVVKPKPKPIKKVVKKTVAKPKPVVAKVKKATPVKGKTNDKLMVKAKPKKVVKRMKRSVRRTKVKAPTKGHVDTYKSFDFSSSISSLMSKGGSAKVAKVAKGVAEDKEFAVDRIEGESAKLEKAKVSHKIGSLAGTVGGKLDTEQGVKGLVDKRSISYMDVPVNTVILGAMDPDIIRRILLDYSPQFRSCYQRVLEQSASGFEGIVPLEFVIGASGHVTKAGLSSAGSSAIPGSVKSCVINILKGIKFPEPLGGGKVGVKQALNFRQNR